MSTMTPQQIEAVLEAQTLRPELEDLQTHEVGEKLVQEGHPAFAPAELALPQGDDGPALPAKTDGFVPEGGEQLGAGDFTVPRLKIRMSGTENAGDVNHGHWFNSVDASMSAERVTFAVLAVRPFYRYNSPHPNAKAPVKRAELDKAQAYGLTVDAEHKGSYCRSVDRLAPVPSDTGVVRPECKACPARKAWDCRPGYVLIAFDVTDYGDGPANAPVLIEFSGTAVKKWKSIQSLLMARCRRGKKNFRDYLVSASTVEEPNYYAPVFEAPVEVEDDVLRELLADAYATFAVEPV